MEITLNVNDALLAQALATFERVADAHFKLEAQKSNNYADIQTQQISQDGLHGLSDLLRQFLNQQNGNNVLQYLMQFLKLPKQPQPTEEETQPNEDKEKQKITTPITRSTTADRRGSER